MPSPLPIGQDDRLRNWYEIVCLASQPLYCSKLRSTHQGTGPLASAQSKNNDSGNIITGGVSFSVANVASGLDWVNNLSNTLYNTAGTSNRDQPRHWWHS